MPRDLNRTIHRLHNEGLGQIVNLIQESRPLSETLELNFGSLAKAKRIQAMVYDLLYFYPTSKAQISLRLSKETGTLYLMLRGRSEKRGRRKLG